MVPGQALNCLSTGVRAPNSNPSHHACVRQPSTLLTADAAPRAAPWQVNFGAWSGRSAAALTSVALATTVAAATAAAAALAAATVATALTTAHATASREPGRRH